MLFHTFDGRLNRGAASLVNNSRAKLYEMRDDRDNLSVIHE